MHKQHITTPKSRNRADILKGLANSTIRKKNDLDCSAQHYIPSFTREPRVEKRRACHSKTRAFFPRQGLGSRGWRGEAHHPQREDQALRLASKPGDQNEMASMESLHQERDMSIDSGLSITLRRDPRHYRSRSDGLSVLARNQTCDCGRDRGSCTRGYDLKEAFIASTSEPGARHPYGSPAIRHLLTELQQLSKLPGRRKLSPMLVADPSSRETQKSIERVQKLSTQKNAAVDMDKLVEWHKRKSLQTQDDYINEETQDIWGGEYTAETSESQERTEVDQERIIPSDKTESMSAQVSTPVHYRGTVELTTAQPDIPRHKRPSREFVESFPPWFLHCDSDSHQARTDQSHQSFLSASVLADERGLGNVDKAETPTITNPVPKHGESINLPVQPPVQDAAAVNHRPLDQALYGVKRILAHHDPLDIVQPSNAPRRRGHQDQSDTQAPIPEIRNWTLPDVNGIIANRAEVRGEACSDNVNAIPEACHMPASEVFATQSNILRRISSGFRSPKTSKKPANFSRLVQSTLDDLAISGNSSEIPPQKCSKEVLSVPPDRDFPTSPHILTRSPHLQPRSGDRTLEQDLFSKHPSYTTSTPKLTPKASATTLDAIEAILPPRSTTASPSHGEPMISVAATAKRNCSFQLHSHRMFAQPPTSPPPRGPLPAIPQTVKTVPKGTLPNSSSKPGEQKDGSMPLLNTSGVLSDSWSSDSSPRLSFSSRPEELAAQPSSIRSTGPLKDKSRPPSTRMHSARSASGWMSQSLDHSGNVGSNQSKSLQRTVSMSSLESSFSDRSKRWVGRPRKDLKMRHLNSARARAENERLEESGGEKSADNISSAGKMPLETNSQTEQSESGVANLQADKEGSEPRSTAVPIQVALQGHGRNNSPHRAQKATDSTTSRSLKRRTSFLGNLGSQELILLSKVSTSPPRSSSAQETRRDHARGDSAQLEEAKNQGIRESSQSNQPITANNLLMQSDLASLVSRPSAIRASSASSLQTVGRAPGNTTVNPPPNTAIPLRAHSTQSNNVMHSSPSTYSGPSTVPSSFSSSSNDSSRLTLLEARCADLEVQLLRHRAWTYAMLFPAQVLQAANPSDLAVAQNAMPPGLGIWTPPPSAAPRDRDGNTRPVPMVGGGGPLNAMYTPRASDESYRSAGTEASGNTSAAHGATEDEGNGKEPQEQSPTATTATRHRLRNAHSSWSLFGGGAVVSDDKKKKRESSSTSNSNRTSSDPYYSDGKTMAMNKRGSFDRILDRFPRREEAAAAAWE